MNIFVNGATGFQGGSIAQALLNDKHQVVTVKRDLNKGNPAQEGIKVLQGSLENQASLSQGMKGAQAAVFSIPLVFDMDVVTSYAQNFIEAAKKENVGLIINNTTFHLAKEKTGFLALDMKVATQKLFDASGLNVITLAPNIYLDNIAAPWSIPTILEHKIVPYPLDAGQKNPWISHADLGKYVAKAIAKPELAGTTLPIGGNLYTGKEITAAIGKKINQDLNFVPVAVDEFEKQLVPGFGDVAAKEISNLYRFIAQNHIEFAQKDFAKTNEILGVKPQSINEWVDTVNWNLS